MAVQTNMAAMTKFDAEILNQSSQQHNARFRDLVQTYGIISGMLILSKE